MSESIQQDPEKQDPERDTLDEPVLDGAELSAEAEREVENERRGMSDPGLIRHPETGEKTPTPDETE